MIEPYASVRYNVVSWSATMGDQDVGGSNPYWSLIGGLVFWPSDVFGLSVEGGVLSMDLREEYLLPTVSTALVFRWQGRR